MNKDNSVVTDDFTPGAGGVLMPIRGTLSSKKGLSLSIPEILVALAASVTAIAIGGGIAMAMNISKDSNAKNALNDIKTAQSIIQNKTGSFADLDTLTNGSPAALPQVADGLKLAASGTQYCAVIKSTSMEGPTYWITAKSGKILEAAPTAAASGITCPTV